MEKQTTIRICDLCEGDVPAVETVRVLWKDGYRSELDLCENDAALIPRARRTRPANTNPDVVTSTVREWARAHGYEVGDKGRIPAEVLAAYNTKH